VGVKRSDVEGEGRDGSVVGISSLSGGMESAGCVLDCGCEGDWDKIIGDG
jgi:hypothetical protein